MYIEEEQISLEFLINTLRNAFFEISEIADDHFCIKIHKYHVVISINEEQKLIRITSTDHICDYQPELFSYLLCAVNEANTSIINVSSYIVHYQDENESSVILRVDQHISFYKGLIMQQFVQLLKDFEEIHVHIFHQFMMNTVELFNQNHIPNNTFIN